MRTVVLGMLLALTVHAQDRSVMWNAAKRVEYGLDRPSTVRPVSDGNVATRNAALWPNAPDIQVFNPSLYWQSENAIAVNFSSPNQLMVSTNGRIPGGTPYAEQTWAFSTDHGATWPASLQSEHLPPGVVDSYGDPVVFFDRSGRAYYFTLGRPGGVFVVSTTDFGATWSARSDADPLHSTGDDKIHAAADFSGARPDNVYAAWTDVGMVGAPVVFSRSTDRGATWGNRQTRALGLTLQQGVHITIGPNGEVYLLWTHYPDFPEEAGIGFCKSLDGGVTFSPPVLAFRIHGTRMAGGIPALNFTRAASFPSADVDRSVGPRCGWINVVTSELDTPTVGQADVALRRSTDGGTSWSPAVRVNGPDVGPGKWQFMPSLAVDPITGAVFVSYYSMDSSGSNFMANRYMAYSADGGVTWDRWIISDVRALWAPQGTPNTNDTYNGDYYETAAMSGTAWATWTDRRLGGAGTNNRAYVERVVYAADFGWVGGTATNIADGAPVPGAVVDFTDPIVQTGGVSGTNGRYLAGARVDTPDTTRAVTLRARRFGFRDTLMSVMLRRNQVVTRHLGMTPVPTGTLVVRTVRRDSAAIAALVTIRLGGNVVDTGRTDAATGMLSRVLPTGTYDVMVDPPSPFGTRRFSGVVVAGGAATPLYVVLRAAVESVPAAMRDTLAVGQVHAKLMVLTNTTGDTIPYRLRDERTPALIRSAPFVPPGGAAAIRRGAATENPRREVPGQAHAGGGGPDAFGYLWVDSDSVGGGVVFTWEDIATIGTQITTWTGGQDNGYVVAALPWSFPFYGLNYGTVGIGTNGFLSLGPVGSTSPNNTALPDPLEPNSAIYAYWDDLIVNSSPGKVYFYVDHARSRFVVQWTRVARAFIPSDTLSFQIILKSNGEIFIHYLATQRTLPNSATVGIENGDGSIATQVVYNNAYLHDRLSIRFIPPDATWLSEDPVAGRIPPGGTENITVTFDATGLSPGVTYPGAILVEAVHPDVAGPIRIPAGLMVSAGSGAGEGVAARRTDFALGQNYPNPFNPRTTIRFGLPSKSHITLAVFNVLGQQVATLAAGDRDAGSHEVQFDASGIPSGVYFYRLTAGAFTGTRRMLLVK